MKQQLKKTEIDDLLFCLMDNEISNDGLRLLDEWLRDTPEAIKYYCDYVNDYVAISNSVSSDFNEVGFRSGNNGRFDALAWLALAEDENNATTVEIEKPIAEPASEIVKIEKQKPSKLSLFTVVISSAAMLLLMLLLLLTPESPPHVAYLGPTVNAVWGQSTVEKGIGEELRIGSYYLEKGLVQILFYDGAKVVLEGPADFKLSSTSAMELISGKLVANVNRAAAGFTVKTPSSKVLDLGTEFGVEVDLTGNSDIHVFDGEVVLYPENTGTKIPLLIGEAKNISTSGQDKDIEINKLAFVRQDEFNSNVKAQQGNAYHRWLSYSYQLRRDPSLVAYYTFEKDDGSPGKLKNISDSTSGKCDGLLLSNNNGNLPMWVAGRWPEKTALKFDRSQQNMVEVPNDPALNISGQITLSVWVNCPDFEEGGGGLMLCSRTRENINYQMSYGVDPGIYRQKVLAFGRYAKYLDPKIKSRIVSFRPNMWHHLVVSHDNQEVRYYIDGNLFDVKPHPFQIAPVEANLSIGNANNYDSDSDLSDRMFNGIMGEVAIFKRVLSSQEIKVMYEAEKP